MIETKTGYIGERVYASYPCPHCGGTVFSDGAEYHEIGCPKTVQEDISMQAVDLSDGSNDGSKNKFYTIPEWVKDVDDLTEYLQLDFFEGNILKTLWSNIGNRHSGTNKTREANKRLHYAKRSVDKLRIDK